MHHKIRHFAEQSSIVLTDNDHVITVVEADDLERFAKKIIEYCARAAVGGRGAADYKRTRRVAAYEMLTCFDMEKLMEEIGDYDEI